MGFKIWCQVGAGGEIFLIYSRSKVPYFFFNPEKFKICNFSWKNEWVSKNCVFFFSGAVFFFPPSEIEWVSGVWTFPGKKKKQNFYPDFWEKKKQRKNLKFDKRCRFCSFLTFFWRFAVSQLSEWLANFSWEKKKTACFFFFPKSGEKKPKLPKSSEWVPPNLFRGKKNTVPLLYDSSRRS